MCYYKTSKMNQYVIHLSYIHGHIMDSAMTLISDVGVTVKLFSLARMNVIYLVRTKRLPTLIYTLMPEV